ncbi:MULTISPECIES: serine hydrolase [unclassified Roseitalea]|uniref:serine hydrolase domain-containing protein n=1 Tax=unclassified Roseitalea TaxID=2639107 RepID=UPI00273F19EC|nr:MULTISPECIES: serine hydrolase [unclassified Roseitalea]
MSSVHAIDALAARAFAPVRAAVEADAIPGAVLGLVTRDGTRAVHHLGLAQRAPETVALSRETWFDLASLTKVIFTTTQVLEEAAKGRIDLDAPLTSLIPDYRQYHADCWERQVTFRQCLGHDTPFPAVAPLYTYGQDPETLRAFILQREWPKGPPVYSDINFIVLGIALERLRGRMLAAMDPGWGLSFAPPADACAATERCTWRGRVMRGQVHDENAFALGGAGHAGLFGTIDAVLDFARDVLAGAGLAAETIALMRSPVRPTRSHGWQTPHAGWSGGDDCNGSVIGHTGFTGTGLWLDFERGRAWSLLTNRVHPSRHVETGINALRRNVGDIVNAN